MNNDETKLRVVITGITGMVGEGVLHECLQDEGVESVLAIVRKPSGNTHPKLTEIIHADFYDLSAISNKLAGYNTCFFCLGVSSVGMKEPEYFRLTYSLTMHVAETMSKLNPGVIFCYISGAGTDTSEKGRLMWARVKGKTENDLKKLPFRRVYNFRPGILTPTPGLRNTLKMYSYFGWLTPIVKLLAPNSISSLRELGQAMIHVAKRGYAHDTLEVKDIRKAASNNSE